MPLRLVHWHVDALPLPARRRRGGRNSEGKGVAGDLPLALLPLAPEKRPIVDVVAVARVCRRRGSKGGQMGTTSLDEDGPAARSA